MKQIGIYKITCTGNNKIYIGQSRNIVARFRDHRWFLKANRHRNIHLQRAYNKYGLEAFTFEIVELCELDKLTDREEYYIEKYSCLSEGFNMAEARNCTPVRLSPEFKQSIGDRLRDKERPMSDRKAISEGMKKRVLSEETKKKIRKSLEGKVNRGVIEVKLADGTIKSYTNPKHIAKDYNTTRYQVMLRIKGKGEKGPLALLDIRYV